MSEAQDFQWSVEDQREQMRADLGRAKDAAGEALVMMQCAARRSVPGNGITREDMRRALVVAEHLSAALVEQLATIRDMTRPF